FSCTGNSLVDYSDEALAEIPPLSWSADDIAFAVELIEEADGIMRDVQMGLDLLKTTPELMAAVERNITYLYRELKKKGKLDERTIRLEWTGTVGGADGTTVVDIGVLQLRCDAV
ncbi:MAG: hypothetical protein SGJ24_19450, partial [Chloroflexota bacterium]|nr:hypothetical protein [Chloroflexota bacterium]